MDLRSQSEVSLASTASIEPPPPALSALDLLKDDTRRADTRSSADIGTTEAKEINMIANMTQILGKGFVLADLNSPGEHKVEINPFTLEIELPRRDRIWHRGNDTVDVAELVSNLRKSYSGDSLGTERVLNGLSYEVLKKYNDDWDGKLPYESQRRRGRELAENMAMIKLAMALEIAPYEPAAAKEMVAGDGLSVKNLTMIATRFGANEENMKQIQELTKPIGGE